MNGGTRKTTSNMTNAVEQIPENKNHASGLTFKFGFKRTPNMNYFIQKCNCPGISVGAIDRATPLRSYPIIGNNSWVFDNFLMSFKIAEDFSNWMEIYNWLQANYAPDHTDQRINDKTAPAGEKTYSDGTLIVYDSKYNPIIEVTMTDMFPINLTGLQFDSTSGEVVLLDSTAEFRFKSFNVRQI